MTEDSPTPARRRATAPRAIMRVAARRMAGARHRLVARRSFLRPRVRATLDLERPARDRPEVRGDLADDSGRLDPRRRREALQDTVVEVGRPAPVRIEALGKIEPHRDHTRGVESLVEVGD